MKPPDYQTVKTSLKSVVKSQHVIDTINTVAADVHSIYTNALQFIKLYLIYTYDQQLPWPVIDFSFIVAALKAVAFSKSTSGRPPNESTQERNQEFAAFYKQHYAQTEPTRAPYTYLNNVIQYAATEIMTSYENNIKQHFCGYVKRFVNARWRKKELLSIADKLPHSKVKINKIDKCFRDLVDDLLHPGRTMKSAPAYHSWLITEQTIILPQRALQKNIPYDLQCSPLDYLPGAFYMMKAIEQTSDYKLYNICPLRTSIAPRHFTLDTGTLINLLITKEYGPKSHYTRHGNIVNRQDEIWGFFFNTEMRCFRKREYQFHHMIKTDGVSCCLIFKHKQAKDRRKSVVESISEQYIDDLVDYTDLKDKKIVAIDPNMSDLLYCVDGAQKGAVNYRYTQNTRRKETKVKKYRNLINEFREETINGKTVKEWETGLSAHNHKTMDFQGFTDYLLAKNRLNLQLKDFYARYIFRKLRLGSYMRRQITESRLLRQFQDKYGAPESTIVTIGDWSQREHRKYHEPIKGKGFRTMFRRAGYSVYLVDEHRTSMCCSSCDGVTEKFLWCDNPRPKQECRILCNGLLRCQSCNKLWNRDVNGASNIYRIAESAIAGLDRPVALSRTESKAVPTKNHLSGSTNHPTNLSRSKIKIKCVKKK